MTPAQLKKFQESSFCDAMDLAELTQEQMEEIANTDLRVKSHGKDLKATRAKYRYIERKAEKSQQQSL